ncbi:MAG TPA: rhodanese-like domain-containing protein [Chloroflexota bacterium]|nr:rhodanese-like domain-containing protein [Chloroflexota bacterium]
MAGTGEPFQRVDVQKAKQLIDEGVPVVDVRNPDEPSKDGEIKNTKLVPLNTFLMNPRPHLDGDRVLLMCKVGQRSAIAAEMAAAVAQADGRKLTAYNMEGGIEAWKKAGFPVDFPKKG